MSELGSGNGTSYPGTLDTDNVLEVNSPSASKTKARAETINDANAAIVAIETELGTDPAGSLTDVKTFLQTQHNSDGTHLAGSVVQVVNLVDGAVATGTTDMPFDDSVPQITEGDQYMSLAITPTSASNKLFIQITSMFAHSVANKIVSGALFNTDFHATNAMAAMAGVDSNAVNRPFPIVINHFMTAPSASETTFLFRAGEEAAGGGTVTFNGAGGGRIFGGITVSSMTITEIRV